MTSDPWQTFVENDGADTVADASSSAQLQAQSSLLCNLDHLGAITIRGEEAEKFLQNQLTNDVTSLPDSHWQRSAWCSPKGRVLSIFRVLRYDAQHFDLVCSRSEITKLCARLRMFVLRAKVEVLAQQDPPFAIVGCIGTTLKDKLQERFEALPGAGPNSRFVSAHGVSVLAEQGTLARYWLIGEAPAMKPLWLELRTHARTTDSIPWVKADIAAGLVDVSAGAVDQYLPQMLNLDHLQAIDFDKGCYPGQEIVARTKYLGRLKRRMVRLMSDTRPSPNAGLYQGDSKVGETLYGVDTEDGKTVSLAVVSIDASRKPGITLDNGDHVDLEVLVEH